ncbi:MAG: lipoyl synthase [Legionellales bacterium]|nr:MAG: lipoyl synthase [Legionellales bacterium]
MARIPVKINPEQPKLKKPRFIKVRLEANASPRINEIKQILREHKLNSVCEEAACPNLPHCFGKGTATFMIMGSICTRRCAFCDVEHGRPGALDATEPKHMATAIAKMQLNYVVITSVDRDDLRDGGAGHFADCITAIRLQSPNTTIEILVPDFRGRMDKALDNLSAALPDVFNHNIETVPSLYKAIRPGSSYEWSLQLLQKFKARFSANNIPTKSGIMLGLGETDSEIEQVLQDLRAHQCDMVTIGQYLQPSKYHAPVKRYVIPEQFEHFKEYAESLGFLNVASGPLVRSSYHADEQAKNIT